jgi:hypothetical protein
MKAFKVTHRDPSTELGMTCFEIGSRTRLAALNAMRVRPIVFILFVSLLTRTAPAQTGLNSLPEVEFSS